MKHLDGTADHSIACTQRRKVFRLLALALVVVAVAGLAVVVCRYRSASAPTDMSDEYELLDIEIAHNLHMEAMGPVPSEGVERAPEQMRKPLVQNGVRLLSKRKPVTCSDDNPIVGSLSDITDGEFGLVEHAVEYEGGRQWLLVDLLGEYDISVIGIWRYGTGGHFVVSDMMVSVSTSSDFSNGAVCVYNNNPNFVTRNIEISRPYEDSRFGKIIALSKPIRARYVRIETDAKGVGTKMAEVMVYGK